MELGTVFSVAENLVSILKSEELKHISSFLGYESQLEDLQRTFNDVKAVLRDAETMELTEKARIYIKELKDAVYDADDLFGELVALAKQNQPIKGGKLSKKVRRLRKLEILGCDIEYLPCLGTLPHLKILRLEELEKLEYILASMEDGCLSFPSLEQLILADCESLKGWRDSRVGVRDSGSSSSMPTLVFPELKVLDIERSEEMKCKLVCPELERMVLIAFNEDLQVNEMRREIGDEQGEAISSSTTNFSSSSSYGVPKLKTVEISNVRWLNRMPMESFQCLVRLCINSEEEMESLGEVGGVLRSCSSTLKTLVVLHCRKLRSVMSRELEHLTCLEELKFSGCGDLSLSEEEEEEEEEEDQNEDRAGVTLPSLRVLKLQRLAKLRYLPKWIRFLGAKLETLEITDCRGLEALPKWMPKLSFLRELKIRGCSDRLIERCQGPNGEDWPLIQRIGSTDIQGGTF